jgi:hypothetical protein
MLRMRAIELQTITTSDYPFADKSIEPATPLRWWRKNACATSAAGMPLEGSRPIACSVSAT